MRGLRAILGDDSSKYPKVKPDPVMLLCQVFVDIDQGLELKFFEDFLQRQESEGP